MSATNHDDLAMGRYGLSFLAPETERAYREWQNEQTLPLFKLICAVSLPGWLLLVVVGTLSGFDYFHGVRLIALCVVLSIIMWGLFLEHTFARRWATLWGALALAITGSVAVVLYGLIEFDSVAVAVCTAVGFSLWLPFVRTPPGMALCVISTYTLPAGAAVIIGSRSGRLSDFETFGFLATICITYLIIAATAITIQRLIRKTFSSQKMVERQRAQLEHSRKLISRYVPSAVADHIIAGEEAAIDSPQRRRVTVLFSDIVGFTDMADRVEPEVLTQIIGEYMAAMAEIVDSHKGTVNEFIGDGLMAIFGAPNALDPESQARGAIRAAQAMHAKLPELNARWRKLGLGEELKIRIGINTGMVSVGSYGSEGRMTYTAIGLQTNIAARIQSHCEPGSILMSDASWQLIRDEIACTPKGEVPVKGVHFPIKIYAAPLSPEP